MEGEGKRWRRNQTGAEARTDCDPRQLRGSLPESEEARSLGQEGAAKLSLTEEQGECHQFPESQRPLVEGTLGIKAIATGYPKNTWWESIFKIIIRSPSLSNSGHLKSRIHFIKHSRKAFMCIYTSIYIYIYMCVCVCVCVCIVYIICILENLLIFA